MKQTWSQQNWYDEINKIAHAFVQNDQELGELLLDHCNWDSQFDRGLTPQQALDEWIKTLEKTNLFKAFKTRCKRQHDDTWWVWKMTELLFARSQLDNDDEKKREEIEIDVELLIDDIIAQYRKPVEE